MSNIKLVRLVTGEVLVGHVQDDDQNNPIALTDIRIEHPFIIGIQPLPDGNMTVNLVPYLPFSEDSTFDIHFQNILHISNPNKGLADKVAGMIATARSGLLLPNKPKLLT
jgi:hypothetical protein